METEVQNEKVTYDEVMQLIKAVSISQRELSESLRELTESQKETEIMFKETADQFKETDKQIKELGKQIGGLGNVYAAFCFTHSPNPSYGLLVKQGNHFAYNS